MKLYSPGSHGWSAKCLLLNDPCCWSWAWVQWRMAQGFPRVLRCVGVASLLPLPGLRGSQEIPKSSPSWHGLGQDLSVMPHPWHQVLSLRAGFQCGLSLAVEPSHIPSSALLASQWSVKRPLEDGSGIPAGSGSSCPGCSNFLPGPCIEKMAWSIRVAFLGSSGLSGRSLQY